MIGQTVSHYRVIERLGAGGMGEVFRAEDLKLARHVALKFLPVDLVGDAQAVKRFLWEARSLSSLSHPNICTVYEVDEHKGRPFIVMELVDGEPLSQVINGQPLPEGLLIALAIQIADGLDAAHQQGLLHRDIKPANIIVNRREQAKILDFGLAKLARDAQFHGPAAGPGESMVRDLTTSPGIAMGTAAYMSPEQARGEKLDHRTDLFSFGLVLYEMATGRQTFSGNTTAVVFDGILNREPLPPARFNQRLPAELERIIGKALEKDRRLRYQSASDIKADLLRLQRQLDAPRQAVSIGDVETLDGGGAVAPITVPAAVAAPATEAAAAVASLPTPAPDPSRVQDVRLPEPPVARKPRAIWRPAVLVAAGTAVLLVVAALLGWMSLRPSDPGATAVVRPTRAADSNLSGAAGSGARAAGREAAARAGGADLEERELAAVRARIAAKQFDQALVDLKAFLAARGGSTLAPDAAFLMAQVTAVQTGRELDAIKLYTDVVARYPNSPRAPEALFSKAGLQERLKLRDTDPKLGPSVPASLATYRAMVDRYPGAVLTQHALFRMAGTYDDMKRYDLAAQAYEKLGAWFPQSAYDGWFRAAELYDRRLRDKDKARDAYLHVPQTSPHYKDAQKRAGR